MKDYRMTDQAIAEVEKDKTGQNPSYPDDFFRPVLTSFYPCHLFGRFFQFCGLYRDIAHP